MTVKEFVSSEIRKALGRLTATVVFGVKVVFVFLVNMIFWFLPIFLLGYLALRPFSSKARSVFSNQENVVPVGGRTDTLEVSLRRERSPSSPDIGETLGPINSFLRELRFLKRS